MYTRLPLKSLKDLAGRDNDGIRNVNRGRFAVMSERKYQGCRRNHPDGELAV